MAEVSLEAALSVYQEKYNQLTTENILLTAKVRELEAELEAVKPNATPEPKEKK